MKTIVLMLNLLEFSMNSFKPFELRRKLAILGPVEGVFESHSIATGRKKGKKRTQKGNFLAN